MAATTESSSPSSAGRVVRIHLACRAALPIGSSLRVTGAHLWDPSSSSNAPADPNAKRGGKGGGSRTVGRSGSFAALGEKRNSDAADEEYDDMMGDGVDADDFTKKMEGLDVGDGVDAADAVMVGVHDPCTQSWYASSVEMVTSPETYPVWKTKRPVVLVLTDPPSSKPKRAGDIAAAATEGGVEVDIEGVEDANMDDIAANGDGEDPFFHHHYRYLVVTPGSEENPLIHGGHSTDDVADMLTIKTKISGNSLTELGTHVEGSGERIDVGVQSSGDLTNFGESSSGGYPVTLWEDPFLNDRAEAWRRENEKSEKGNFANRKMSASSLYSAVSTNDAVSDDLLANLPYRTLDIDVATATYHTTATVIAKSSSMDECDAGGQPEEYTADGIVIDSWNGRDDATFRTYVSKEAKRTEAKAEEETASEDSGSFFEEGKNIISRALNCQGEGCYMDVEPSPRAGTGSEGRRIYIVCYHLPVLVFKDPVTNEWTACWTESLLAKTENSAFVTSHDPHWVGTVTTNPPISDEADKVAIKALLAGMDCTPLFFDQATRDAHYQGFCKQVLWLAFHHVDLFDARNPAFSFDMNAAGHPVDEAEAAAGGGGEGIETTLPGLEDLGSAWDQRLIGKWWGAYNRVNQTFAEEVAKMISHPEDVVWVHDYHLALVPRMLGEEERKLHKTGYSKHRGLAKKIFFLHIPFPASMLFRELECGDAVLEGMLHADVVGFHNFTDARHFLSCSKRVLGLDHNSLEGGLIGVSYKGRTVVVTMSSVSIDPVLVDAALQLPTTVSGAAALRAKHAGRKIIVGVDNAQYLSGIGLKLNAYERLLADSAVWRDKLVLVQRCLVPGARRLDEYRTLREIRAIVKRIQKRFGESAIDYEEVYGSSMPVDQRLALWKASDCLLNSELRGGFHPWPLEFIYAQKGCTRPGVVIASEYSAVFGILNGALRISPFDMDLTISAIDRALTMSDQERQTRFLRDNDFVSTATSDRWVSNVLRDLHDKATRHAPDDHDEDHLCETLLPCGTKKDAEGVSAFLTRERERRFTRLNPQSVLSAYKQTSRRVFILDFNGTIVLKEAADSFVKRDTLDAAGDAPPMDVIKALDKLCKDPQNTVFIVSGDSKHNMEKAIGNVWGLGLAASNGSSFSPPMKPGQTSRTWLSLDLGVDWDSVKRVAVPILSKFTARANGSFIKLTHSSIGWSYYSCDPEMGSLLAKYLVLELERELAAFDVRFVNLKGVVEIVPRRLNKGILVKKILRDVAAQDNSAGVDFVLCMGDDISDEKMFTSVLSFVSEMDEDYINVVPSPPVVGTGMPQISESLLAEVPRVRCRNLDKPMFAFTAAVGKKASHASQFIDDAVDVADLLVKIARGCGTGRWSRNNEAEEMFA